MKRQPMGHSNVVNLREATVDPDGSGSVMIPLVGGAHVESVKRLPPLALARHEWLVIGEIGGWLNALRSPEERKQ